MFRRFMSVPLALLLLLAGSAYPQSAKISGPLAGFVYSPVSRSVRPIFGVPGAVYAASPVLSGVDLASVAPGGRWSFAVTGGRVSLIQDVSTTSTETPVNGLISAVDRIV